MLTQQPLLPEVSKISGTLWYKNKKDVTYHDYHDKGNMIKKLKGSDNGKVIKWNSDGFNMEASEVDKMGMKNLVFSRKSCDITKTYLAVVYIVAFCHVFRMFWYLEFLKNQNHYWYYLTCLNALYNIYVSFQKYMFYITKILLYSKSTLKGKALIYKIRIKQSKKVFVR